MKKETKAEVLQSKVLSNQVQPLRQAGQGHVKQMRKAPLHAAPAGCSLKHAVPGGVSPKHAAPSKRGSWKGGAQKATAATLVALLAAPLPQALAAERQAAVVEPSPNGNIVAQALSREALSQATLEELEGIIAQMQATKDEAQQQADVAKEQLDSAHVQAFRCAICLRYGPVFSIGCRNCRFRSIVERSGICRCS